jgi:hypothetical protein
MRAERGAGDSFEVNIDGPVQEGAQVGVGKNIQQNYRQADERSPARRNNLLIRQEYSLATAAKTIRVSLGVCTID